MRLVTLSGKIPGLGVTATQPRTINGGHQYNHLMPMGQLERKTVTTMSSASPYDTLRHMKKLVSRTLNQTSKLAPTLKGSSLSQTVQNIWGFVYNNIQYKLDTPGIEEIKTPVRIWADRATGSDCDDYSIFISSLLSNLAIPHAFRMTKYTGDWQHVYVVVPKDGSTRANSRTGYYVLDAVAERFNYEHPFSEKHDLPMKTPLVTLSGYLPQNQPAARPLGQLGDFGCGCDQPTPSQGQETNDQQTTVQKVETIRVAELERNGFTLTAEVLTKANIPFETITNKATGKPAIAVQVGKKTAQLPIVIPMDQAELIVQGILHPELLLENQTSKASIGTIALILTGLFLAGKLLGGNYAATKTKKPAKKKTLGRKPKTIDLRKSK